MCGACSSCDGHIKFWKKMKEGVEFVKHYRAHLGAIRAISVSADGLKMCSVGDDNVCCGTAWGLGQLPCVGTRLTAGGCLMTLCRH